MPNSYIEVLELAWRLHRNWMKRYQEKHPNGILHFIPQAQAFLGKA
jgi:hypothetical protein